MAGHGMAWLYSVGPIHRLATRGRGTKDIIISIIILLGVCVVCFHGLLEVGEARTS